MTAPVDTVTAAASTGLPAWLTVTLAVVPLATIVGSAIAFFVRSFSEASDRRRTRLFELMAYLDSPAPIAAKMAAAYLLRKYPADKAFIIRFCEARDRIIQGNTADLLKDELRRTSEHLGGR